MAIHFDEPVLDAADRRFKGGINFQELLLEAAWANGYDGRTFRDHRAVLRFAFSQGIAAASSTIDIGGILSNVANKFLLDGFFSVERTWRNICAIRSVTDFKTVTSYRLIGKDQYEQVQPGGEIKQGTLGNEARGTKTLHAFREAVFRASSIGADERSPTRSVRWVAVNWSRGRASTRFCGFNLQSARTGSWRVARR